MALKLKLAWGWEVNSNGTNFNQKNSVTKIQIIFKLL